MNHQVQCVAFTFPAALAVVAPLFHGASITARKKDQVSWKIRYGYSSTGLEARRISSREQTSRDLSLKRPPTPSEIITIWAAFPARNLLTFPWISICSYLFELGSSTTVLIRFLPCQDPRYPIYR